ncbi:MAG: hypothetical protein ACF8PN_17470 [Phycisphaerales bacterium]
MNPLRPRWLRVCTIGMALYAGSGVYGLLQPTAESLYEQGQTLFEDGELLEAKEILLRIDLAELGRAERTDVYRMFDAIDAALKQMPETELRIRKAELDMERGAYARAVSNLQFVVDSNEASASEKSEAESMLEKVYAMQDRIAPQVPAMIEQASADFQAGNYAAAKAKLIVAHNSGVKLNLDQQTELSTLLEEIYTIEAEQNVEFDTSGVDLAIMEGSTEPMAMVQPATDDPAPQPVEDDPSVEEVTDETDQPMDDEPAMEDEYVAEQPEEEMDEPFDPPADLIFQAQQAEAARLLSQAQEAQAEGRYAAALALYERVLAVQPDNEIARQGRDQVNTLLNQGSVLQETIQDTQVLAQQLRAEFNNLLEQARIRRDQGDYNLGYDLVTQAKVILSERRRYLSQDEYEALRQEAIDLAEEIRTQQSADELRLMQEREQQMRDIRRTEREQLEQERRRQIAEKLMNIRRLQLAQKYDEALLELDALLFLDPGNPAAIALKETIREIQIYREYDRVKRDNNLRVAENSLENLKSQRMPRDVVEYPEDWPALTIRRTENYAFQDSEIDRKVWDALASKRVPVNFSGHPFGDVVNFIGEVASVNVDVDWKSLEENFIDRNTSVNLKLNDNVPLQVVLERVLEKLGEDEESRPHYAISDGILTIASKEKLQQKPVTHVYDIKDLLIEIPNFGDAPDFDLESILDRQRSDSIQNRLFGESDREEDYDPTRLGRDEMIERLRDIITRMIDPRSWQINGGEIGEIEELNGNFIIRTTARNHRDISNLLGKLREIRALQINVESRFLLVTEEFFEKIGFDLDIFWGGAPFNRDSELDPNLLPSDLFIDRTTNTIQPVGQRQYFSLFELVPAVDANGNPIRDANRRQLVDQNIPDAGIFQQGRHTFGPWSVQQNSLGLADALFGADASSLAGQALAASPAFTYGITYLDEVQVDLFIEATQADRRNVQLTAPKLTFFNGQRAFVQVTTSRFFVSDLQPVVGDSSAGFDPTLSPLREGVVLDVEGTVSADRRYVTLTVLTSLAKVLDIQSTSVPIVVGGQVVASGQQNNILSQTAFIERPIIQISRVNTSVTVPDKGTILLGGQSIKNDIELETGVPVLSKIPIINRFFTNRVMSTEERTLLILLKPTVILQQENEELLFPGLQDALRSSGSYGSRF